MKSIHQYNFYRKKYGIDLLIDVVAIKDFKKYIEKNRTHRLSHFDLTFIVEGNEELVINDSKMLVKRGDIVCSIPGQVWSWQKNTKLEGYALVFEEDFILSFFMDRYFCQLFCHFVFARFRIRKRYAKISFKFQFVTANIIH